MHWILTLGIRTLSYQVLASTNFNYVELSCGQTAGIAMGTPLFLSLLTLETGLE
jgi:hypothetical protein